MWGKEVNSHSRLANKHSTFSVKTSSQKF